MFLNLEEFEAQVLPALQGPEPYRLDGFQAERLIASYKPLVEWCRTQHISAFETAETVLHAEYQRHVSDWLSSTVMDFLGQGPMTPLTPLKKECVL